MMTTSILFGLKASAQETNIAEDIDNLGDALVAHLGMEDLYVYASNFNLKETQAQFQLFFISDIFEKFLNKWQMDPGVEYVKDGDPDNLPPGRIYIQIKNDKSELPYRFSVRYRAKNNLVGEGGSFLLDLWDPEFEKKIKIVRENDLKYTTIKMCDAIEKEVDTVFEKLITANNNDRIKMIADFNNKWKDTLEMTFTLSDNGRGLLKVADKFQLLSFERISNHMRVETIPTPRDLSPALLSLSAQKGYLKTGLFAVALTAAIALGSAKIYRHFNSPNKSS